MLQSQLFWSYVSNSSMSYIVPYVIFVTDLEFYTSPCPIVPYVIFVADLEFYTASCSIVPYVIFVADPEFHTASCPIVFLCYICR